MSEEPELAQLDFLAAAGLELNKSNSGLAYLFSVVHPIQNKIPQGSTASTREHSMQSSHTVSRKRKNKTQPLFKKMTVLIF